MKRRKKKKKRGGRQSVQMRRTKLGEIQSINRKKREIQSNNQMEVKVALEKAVKKKQTILRRSGVSLQSGGLSGDAHKGCGASPKTTSARQCKSKRYFALFYSFKRALSAINSLIIAGDYRRLSHSTFCKASLLGYGLTILFYSYFPKLLPGPSFFLLPLLSKQTPNIFIHRLTRFLSRNTYDDRTERKEECNTQVRGKEVKTEKNQGTDDVQHPLIQIPSNKPTYTYKQRGIHRK